MKLASLKGPSRDGTLVVVKRDLTRAARVDSLAPTMQKALEYWDVVADRLRDVAASLEAGGERHTFDFREALQRGEVDAPIPRAYEWLDGSAYLSHVERVRRARNDTVPDSFHSDPLMYQGGAGRMGGPRDPIRVLTEDWGVDLEGEVAVITGDVPMGAGRAETEACVRMVALVNDVSFRRLIPAELAKGFGFVNGKGANSMSAVAVTPDELGGAWREGKLHRPRLCDVNGQRLGQPDAGKDMTFSFPELIAHAARTRELPAGTLVGSGTVSNHDRGAGYACLMEARLVEQVESGAAKTSFLRFGDTVRIEMPDESGSSIFGAIEQRVERYER